MDVNECRHSFNPSKAKWWKVSNTKQFIVADAEIIHWHFNDGESDNRAYLNIRNGEAGIHERMIKALLRLATQPPYQVGRNGITIPEAEKKTPP